MAGCRSGDPVTVAERLRGVPGSTHLAAMSRSALLVALALVLTAALALGTYPTGNEEKSCLLTASNWTLLLQGEWMVKFFAPWCSACQQIQADWEEFAQSSVAINIMVGKVDVTEEPGLSGRFFVTTLPTIFHAKEGVFRKYRGSRTSEELQNYIIFKKWEGVEPITGWKSPSSITMYCMSGLFHLSGWIRQMHSYLTGPLGIPIWGSYIIFIVSILLIGLLLGLILVLLADCICPPKPGNRVEQSEEVNEKEIVEILDEEHEAMLDEKEDLEDSEDEENNGSDKASEEKASEEKASEEGFSAEEGGSEPREQVEIIPEEHLDDPEAESESSVRQRKVPMSENEQ